MFLDRRSLDQLRADFPDLCIHDNFGPRRCSVHTVFDGCPERAGYVLQTDQGEPTDSLVCERCKPMVEHLIATRPRFRGYSLVAFAHRPEPEPRTATCNYGHANLAVTRDGKFPLHGDGICAESGQRVMDRQYD